jgi:adenylate cyclase
MDTMTERTTLSRRSAAVLNGDIANFSGLIADDVGATIEGVERARSVTKAAVEATSGTLVDFIGDNFMAVFPTVVAALEAARRIQQTLADEAREQPSRRRVMFRMGVAVGELVADGDAVFGDAVNIAARVRDTVEPGGIALTGEAVVRLDAPDLPLEPLGRHHFRNIPEPVHVYRLLGLPSGDVRRGPFETPGQPTPVLSFTGAVPLVEDDPFLVRASRLLTQELRAGLLTMPAMTLMNAEVDRVGDGGPVASHVLQAWCDRDGEDGRLYFELVKIDRWVPQWGERYTFACDQLTSHLDAIVSDVVAAVDVNVVLGEYGRHYRSELSSRSVALLHRAHAQMLRGTAEALLESRRTMEQVVTLEPGSSDVRALSAFVTLVQVLMGHSPDPEADLRQASALAAAAREMGDRTGMADMVDAQILAWRGAVVEARQVADRSLATRSTCDATYAVKASVLRYLGEWEEAIDLARQALDLAPSSPPWYRSVLAAAYFLGERHAEVVDTLEPMMTLGVADAEALLLLAASRQALGMRRSARSTLEEFRMRHPRVSPEDAVRAHPYAQPAVVARWLALLEAIER